MRHDPQDGEAGDRTPACRRGLRRPPTAVAQEHRRGGLRDRGEGAGHRRAHLAKRLLPLARTAGDTGSARNFRRAVAEAKKAWRRRRRVYRPWQPTPGEHLVIDWTTEGGWQVFCAVLAWSRWRFVRLATDQKAATTMALLAECFEELGGVPQVVLTDRMGCLKGGVVANVVVPTADYVRFATHYLLTELLLV